MCFEKLTVNVCGMKKYLCRNATLMQTRATNFIFFYERSFYSKLGSLYGCYVTARPATNDYQIEGSASLRQFYPSFFQVNNITNISAMAITIIAFGLISGMIDFSIDKDNNLPIMFHLLLKLRFYGRKSII